MELTCPKCQASMRQYERNGVVIDQCSECRGIYLDRGELEKLMDAESAFYAGSQAAPTGPPPGAQPQQAAMPQRRGWGSPGSPDSPDRRYGYGHPEFRKRSRRSFLSDLFD
ncbi:zf-TFIIB domain-containing protein [Microlunatus sp. Y2014]|uniref:TFIIB-type zinc ribbon-containing protein n=1 Tax=Microlunatus sp. Y2014 TaxID=3418488 RepID=UPI003DA6F6E2